MTRTLKLSDTTCIECYGVYETVEEAIECENLDRAEREAEEWEIIQDQAAAEQDFWERDAAYLKSLHQVGFGA